MGEPPQAARRRRRCPAWVFGLFLPPLLLLLLATGLTCLEYRTHACSRWLGACLLSGNDARECQGAVWEGILASRRAQARLGETSAADTLPAGDPPPSALRNRFTAELRSRDFLVLSRRQRRTPLNPQKLSRVQVRDLAASMQIYRQGRDLLAGLRLARAPFAVHARIQAQIQLEEGALFAALQRQLEAQDAPQSWDFVRMSAADRASWTQLLTPALTPGDSAVDLRRRAPAVAAALLALTRNWADSLRREETQRLRAAWEHGPDFQVRLARNMNAFLGYAIRADERPVPFELSAEHVARVMGWSPETKVP